MVASLLSETVPGSITTSPETGTMPQKFMLFIGVFFDGTGNNAVNTRNMLKACTKESLELNAPDAESLLSKYARAESGISGARITSYTNYYTNIYWLSTLYKTTISPGSSVIQKDMYIDGIGTCAGKPDSIIAQGLGISDTGVRAKTDTAISMLSHTISAIIKEILDIASVNNPIISSLHFDIFGFSRGAVAARHFANRIRTEDPDIIKAINLGMSGTSFQGSPSGKTRFIGIFDTVSGIGTPMNGLNPHSADSGKVKLALPSDIAEKVFHITAANECRYNFALNSVKPVWPELALPGAHSDIGGGYFPVMKEDLFLTRPVTETVPYSYPDEKTHVYQQAMSRLSVLRNAPLLAPLLRTNNVSVETWHDDRLSADRYGQMQKRSYAALTLRNRIVRNDWSRVVLRVMIDAAQDTGVLFNAISEKYRELILHEELISLCNKAQAMGKAVRSGEMLQTFSVNELDMLAEKYIHCSAHWNAIGFTPHGRIHGGAFPFAVTGFIHRPDEQWQRTVYNMDGKKV